MDTPRPTNPPDPELVQAIYAVGQTYWLSYNLCIRIADACEAWLGERLAAAEHEPWQMRLPDRPCVDCLLAEKASECTHPVEVWTDGPAFYADELAAAERAGMEKAVGAGYLNLVAAAEREGAEKDALLARADNLLGHASHSGSRCEPPDGRSMESWCSVCSWREDLAAASPLPDTGDTA